LVPFINIDAKVNLQTAGEVLVGFYQTTCTSNIWIFLYEFLPWGNYYGPSREAYWNISPYFSTALPEQI
jgi:hypothetical protein